MKAPGNLRRQLSDALVGAFNEATLARCVRDRLDVRLEKIVKNGTLRAKVDDLLSWAEREGRLEELVDETAAEVPGNEALQRASADFRAFFDRRTDGGAPNAGVRVEIDRLPPSGHEFVAREAELRRLDAAWDDAGTNVVSIVAWGGVGKSALVNRWLARTAVADWREAARVYGWSFFHQETEEASADEFIDGALRWFDDRRPPPVLPRDRGRRLAELVRRERTLLVLDGVEPLQHPPGPLGGRLKDPALAVLIKALAAHNPGLCLITTREPIDDLAPFSGATATRLDLEELGIEGGAELLRRLGVMGTDEKLRQAARELGGHALALTLLGTYLRRALKGDVRRWREVPLGKADQRHGGQAYRMVAAYETWFQKEGMATELAVLRLLGLFDRPADAGALAALRAAPEVPDLNRGLAGLAEDDWQWALSNLHDAGLVAPAEPGIVDARPLVRSYFGDRLREDSPEAWRTGHERLYESYRNSAPELPGTVEEMIPLWAAVTHGCQAGKHQEAFDEVYRRRIDREDEFYSTDKLGAFGADLIAIAGFFARPWREPAAGLREDDKAFLLNAAGFRLRALGRLAEAAEPMRASTDMDAERGDWQGAAASAGSLSELHLTLGDVAQAVTSAEESVELADRSDDAFLRMVNRTILANALHQSWRIEESAAAFRQAEDMQADDPRQYRRLFSLRGYQYCDLLLGSVGGPGPREWSGLEGPRADPAPLRRACRAVLERVQQTLGWGNETGRYKRRDVALDHLSLGRARFGLALAESPKDRAANLTAAAKELDFGLGQAREEEFVARGHLHRAALRRVAGDRPGAEADLAEAQEIAKRGAMRLHLCDAHLEWTRLHLAAGEAGDAGRRLDAARSLVEECGYHRRDPDVEYLAARLAAAGA